MSGPKSMVCSKEDLRTDDFDFDLPAASIAKEPVRPRDTARMLEIDSTFTNRNFRDLPKLLTPSDLIVLNDTKVIPARLRGHRRGAKVEITILKKQTDGLWQAFARPAKKLSINDIIKFSADFSARVCEKREGGEVIVSFSSNDEFWASLAAHGEMPLPPYIGRRSGPVKNDFSDYQTVYADREGAVAAPTAGLHFTEPLLDAIRSVGVRIETVTLHVGAGTFLPVKVDRVVDHRMHSEWGEVTPEAADNLNAARAAGGRIVSVGTTVARLLETAVDARGYIKPYVGETNIFIAPGYRFRAVDALITNFHLPRSTLFMLVAAFAGLGRVKRAYAHAIEQGYRFYSYGDSSFLHRFDQNG